MLRLFVFFILLISSIQCKYYALLNYNNNECNSTFVNGIVYYEGECTSRRKVEHQNGQIKYLLYPSSNCEGTPEEMNFDLNVCKGNVKFVKLEDIEEKLIYVTSTNTECNKVTQRMILASEKCIPSLPNFHNEPIPFLSNIKKDTNHLFKCQNDKFVKISYSDDCKTEINKEEMETNVCKDSIIISCKWFWSAPLNPWIITGIVVGCILQCLILLLIVRLCWCYIAESREKQRTGYKGSVIRAMIIKNF